MAAEARPLQFVPGMAIEGSPTVTPGQVFLWRGTLLLFLWFGRAPWAVEGEVSQYVCIDLLKLNLRSFLDLEFSRQPVDATLRWSEIRKEAGSPAFGGYDVCSDG